MILGHRWRSIASGIQDPSIIQFRNKVRIHHETIEPLHVYSEHTVAKLRLQYCRPAGEKLVSCGEHLGHVIS